MTHPVTIPLLNPNEPEALLAALEVSEGQQVTAGSLLCTLETTKSTAEVMAEHDGYVVGLRAAPGDLLRAGDLLCYLAGRPDWKPPEGAAEPQGIASPPRRFWPGAPPWGAHHPTGVESRS